MGCVCVYIYVYMYVCVCIYIYTKQYYSTLKMKEILSHAKTWMNLEDIC